LFDSATAHAEDSDRPSVHLADEQVAVLGIHHRCQRIPADLDATQDPTIRSIQHTYARRVENPTCCKASTGDDHVPRRFVHRRLDDVHTRINGSQSRPINGIKYIDTSIRTDKDAVSLLVHEHYARITAENNGPNDGSIVGVEHTYPAATVVCNEDPAHPRSNGHRNGEICDTHGTQERTIGCTQDAHCAVTRIDDKDTVGPCVDSHGMWTTAYSDSAQERARGRVEHVDAIACLVGHESAPRLLIDHDGIGRTAYRVCPDNRTASSVACDATSPMSADSVQRIG
jgi:hypothetical protein